MEKLKVLFIKAMFIALLAAFWCILIYLMYDSILVDRPDEEFSSLERIYSFAFSVAKIAAIVALPVFAIVLLYPRRS